ncbi:MAG: prephenate dehydrogenase/arogenate dehydrogenase family protein [Abyssibacter sp.]|nr:prephenate dehydrogenase/arogenate dehydrogenase family protein [Abyssibacter sp.]MCK5859720.1 prephenate dehydrogenase/arogenate dehydrogenase family protein [Abyssibacter sp.]
MIQSQRIAIYGVGLIGGSVALALRAAGYEGTILGFGRRESELTRAVALGVIDEFSTEADKIAANADLHLLCVPVLAMESVLAAIARVCRDDAVITDVGSTKQSVIAAARRAFGALPSGFVPAHPIAGTERTGVAAAFPELYRERLAILTPTEQSAESSVREVEQLWRACGARTIRMAADHHDDVLAATSHLPHMLAFALVEMLATRQDHDEIFMYAAGGFRDFTRIASSSPEMWRDIALANQQAVSDNLAALIDGLQTLKQAIDDGDASQIESRFRCAKRARDEYVALTGDRAAS